MFGGTRRLLASVTSMLSIAPWTPAYMTCGWAPGAHSRWLVGLPGHVRVVPGPRSYYASFLQSMVLGGVRVGFPCFLGPSGVP